MIWSDGGLRVGRQGVIKIEWLIPMDDVEMVVLLFDPTSWVFDVTPYLHCSITTFPCTPQASNSI